MVLTRQMQPSFAAGEVSPALYARVDLSKYQSGLKVARNVFIHPQGGASNRAGLEFCEEVKDSSKATRMIPFQFSTAQSYVLEFGDGYMRVMKDGAQILDPTDKTITLIEGSTVTSTAHGFLAGDEIYITGTVGTTNINGRNFRVSAVTTDTFDLLDLYGEPVSTPSYTSGGVANKVYEISSPYGQGDLFDVQFAQEADVMYLVHPNYQIRKISRFSETNWTITTPTFAPAIAAPTGVSAVATTGTGTTSYQYKVSAISSTTGEESLPSTASAAITNNLNTAGNKNTVSWSAVAGASRYIVYKLDNGVYGYIGGTEGTSFVDQNIVADLADTPQTGNNPFVGAGNYPRAITFHEQRLVLGGTLNNPQAVYLSQSANYENFGGSSPQKSSDAITFRLRGRQVNEIRSMISAKGLLLLTSAAEWMIDGAGEDVLTPSSIRSVNQGYRGAAKIPPLVVGNVVLFAQRAGRVIRDFSYDFAEDSFTGADLSLMAAHLFKKRTVKAWAYAQSPYSVVWCILDNGQLVSLTYLREHEVWAWTRHDTDGTFKDVVVLQEEEGDTPYFIVERTINGQTKQYIERMLTREIETLDDCYFVDAGIYYNGPPVTSLTGLWHLEGEAVVALTDGNVVRDLTITGGAVTLPNAASVIALGLPFTAELETLSLDAGAVKGLGTLQARLKSVPVINIRLEQTRGIWVGPNRNRMREWKQRATEPYGQPIALYTGDAEIGLDPDWNTAGSIVIQQNDPLPMTVLAVMPDVQIGS